MGNSHPHSNAHFLSTSKKRKKFGRQRRLSDPIQNNQKNLHYLFPGSSANQSCTTPPTIQINGEASFDESTDQAQMREKSASTDFTAFFSTKPNASERRKMFLTSSANMSSIARSLDESMTAKMSALVRTKSHSPLKQMRTYSFRSISSEENLIGKESCQLVTKSWHLVEMRSAEATSSGANFGCFVFRRLFAKIPSLRPVFGVKSGGDDNDKESDDSLIDILDLPETHPIRRHARLFTNILHIAVKSVDQLEAQVAPTIFKYGERHYRPDISPHMTEENVRIFCAQIVCTVFDFLENDEATPKCAESWIELMRYLGQKLLDGHEFAKLTAEKKISINRNDHHLFLML